MKVGAIVMIKRVQGLWTSIEERKDDITEAPPSIIRLCSDRKPRLSVISAGVRYLSVSATIAIAHVNARPTLFEYLTPLAITHHYLRIFRKRFCILHEAEPLAFSQHHQQLSHPHF